MQWQTLLLYILKLWRAEVTEEPPSLTVEEVLAHLGPFKLI